VQASSTCRRWLPPPICSPLWLSAVYPASHRSTTKVKAFVDFLRARYLQEPPWDRALGITPPDDDTRSVGEELAEE
jgi:hypothetical protein